MSARLRWLVLVLIAFSTSLFAETIPPDWTAPMAPHRIAGNVYYVGSRDLASYLITTPQGHILINSNLEQSVDSIRHNVEALGFRFSDIRILLISHAHFDHCAGSAKILELTHAKYMVMDADVAVVEDGGRSDFQYGGSAGMHFPPAHVDRRLHDGDQVRLGNTVLTAHLTPGHTRGCTTWTLKVIDDGRTYNVVIVGSPNVNPGYRLVNNPVYPQIAQDYARGFQTLKALPCDIFLGAHGSYFDLVGKLALIAPGKASPFVDPEGYRRYIADREAAFEAELARQQQAARH